MENEKKQIEDLILNYYHKGHEISDGELYRSILHDNWQIFWINQDDKVECTDKDTYISWYKPENRNERLKWTTEILSIDIEGKLAIAKIKIFNQDFGFLDYFSLMKEDGKWWIVNKISKSLDKK